MKMKNGHGQTAVKKIKLSGRTAAVFTVRIVQASAKQDASV